LPNTNSRQTFRAFSHEQTTPHMPALRSSRLPLRLALCLCVACGVAYAAPGTAQDTPNLWSSNLEFGYTGANGNTSFSILSAAASLSRVQQERFELELSGRFRWGKNDDEVIANDVQATTKFDWQPQATISPFLFATGSRDVIRNLDGRLLAGGGAKWTFWLPSPETKMSASLAAVVDHENYRLEAGSPGPETITVARWSGRVKFDHSFGSGAAFQHITFWQPQMSGFSDYLVDISNSLSTRLLSNLSLVINHSFIHDEVPPPGAEKDDQRLAVVLRVSL